MQGKARVSERADVHHHDFIISLFLLLCLRPQSHSPFLILYNFFNINGKKHRKQNLETSVGLAFNIKMLSLDKIEGIEAR